MRTQRMAVWILVLVLAIPTVAIAQNPPDYGPVSVDTPNDKNVGGIYYNVVPATDPSGTMRVRINLRSRIPWIEGELVCNPSPNDGETGQTIAKRSVDALCTNAVNSGNFTCSGVRDFSVPCAGIACCAESFAAPSQSVGITCKTVDNVSFTLSRLANDVEFNVLTAGAGPSGGTQVVAFQTHCGNTIGKDLWPWVLVQLLPNGVNGVVSYDVYHPQGGTNPRSFSVDTSAYSTSKALHDAIAAGFSGLGLGLQVESQDGASARGNSPLLNPDDGYFVVIHNAKAKVTEIRSRALEGQSSEIQTGDRWEIPTLSEWGMIFVVALLMATGYWMLRRRKQTTGRA